jgi:hypothetical protein
MERRSDATSSRATLQWAPVFRPYTFQTNMFSDAMRLVTTLIDQQRTIKSLYHLEPRRALERRVIVFEEL